MLGQTVEAKSPTNVSTLAWFILGLVLIGAGVVSGNTHYGMAALLPILLAVFLWSSRPRSVVFTIEETGIVLFGTDHRLGYDQMSAVFVGDQLIQPGQPNLPQGAITVAHKDGRFFIPALMSVPADELGAFLANQIKRPDEQPLPSALAEYAAQQEEKFGKEKLTFIHQRPKHQDPIQVGSTSSVGKAFLLCGIIWFVSSAVISEASRSFDWTWAWIGIGIGSAFLGGTLWTMGKTRKKRIRMNSSHGPAGLIIGPAGLGLAQGELQGKMRWDEISGIKNGPVGTFSSDRDGALRVSFVGGELAIYDIYDHSLTQIAGLISKNLRSPN